LGEGAVKVKTSKYIRIHPECTYADAKICGHYVNSILASIAAKAEGCDEALLLDYKGNVAEGPGENLFIVSHGKVSTPPLGTILKGITRASIIEIAKAQGMEMAEEPIDLEDVYSADEAFFTGTAAEVTPIESVDENKFSTETPGPVTAKIRDTFMDIVHGKNEKYKHWLDYVRP
jgi:branched-chain amino acid aminotransferase